MHRTRTQHVCTERALREVARLAHAERQQGAELLDLMHEALLNLIVDRWGALGGRATPLHFPAILAEAGKHLQATLAGLEGSGFDGRWSTAALLGALRADGAGSMVRSLCEKYACVMLPFWPRPGTSDAPCLRALAWHTRFARSACALAIWGGA